MVAFKSTLARKEGKVIRFWDKGKKAAIFMVNDLLFLYSHIDCGSGYSTPSSSPNNVHGTYSRGVSNMGYTTRDLSVLGQSISYSLSQQRYPYLAECQVKILINFFWL